VSLGSTCVFLPEKAGSAGEPGWLCLCRQGEAVRGLEEDLLQRPGQVSAPHNGCRRRQRMVFEFDSGQRVGQDPASGSGLAPRRGYGEAVEDERKSREHVTHTHQAGAEA
jgi:hypothetical protein